MKSTLPSLAVLSLLGTFASTQAGATNLYDPTVSSTTILDGSSLELDGTLNDTNGNSQPWVAEVYAGTGECMRLFVTTTAFDAKLTVIAPNGAVYRDDDSGGSLRPLVKLASAPMQGWYTVQVAHYAGLPINANFTLRYGRYTAGNVNCSVGTVPLTHDVNEPEAAKDTSLVVPEPPRRANAP